jgi:hypothetical protein
LISGGAFRLPWFGQVVNVEQIRQAGVSIMEILMCEALGNLGGSGL